MSDRPEAPYTEEYLMGRLRDVYVKRRAEYQAKKAEVLALHTEQNLTTDQIATQLSLSKRLVDQLLNRPDWAPYVPETPEWQELFNHELRRKFEGHIGAEATLKGVRDCFIGNFLQRRGKQLFLLPAFDDETGRWPLDDRRFSLREVNAIRDVFGLEPLEPVAIPATGSELRRAAKLLREHGYVVTLLANPISELPPRTQQALFDAGIETLQELRVKAIKPDDLLHINNVGRPSVNAILALLKKYPD